MLWRRRGTPVISRTEGHHGLRHPTSGPSDIPGIKSVTKDADIFPPDMLDAMIAGYMGQVNGDIRFVPVADGQVAGFDFCEPERMTSWDME